MGKNLDRLKQAYALGTPGMAQTLGAMGRGNDSLVAHITPEEAMLLKQRGGAGTINPRTGLLEFYDSDGGGNASDGGNPTGGDSGGGSEGNNDGWGGGDWGGNVDFGGWEGWGAPSAPSTPGLGFAGDDPNSGMANIFGNSAPGLGFAGDNADYGMANIIGDSTANITSNADGGNDGYNNAPGNYDGNTYVPPVFTEPPTTTAPPATTTPSTGGTTPSTGGTTTGGTTTTPATPGTFQFAAPVSPAFYGFELNRLMRQYGVPAPTIMPYGGAAASTAQADAAKAAYDQNVYQNYVNEYQNRLANTNMYNMAQFTPNPANFRPQYAAPIANPTYAPANYGGIADVYSKYFGRQPEQAGVEYWGKTGLTGDALQKAITTGAQNSDLEYLRKNYPNMGFARGGRVGYAEGGETEVGNLPDEEFNTMFGNYASSLPPPDGAATAATGTDPAATTTSAAATPAPTRSNAENIAALLRQYAMPTTNYGAQLAGAQQTARSETEAFSNMIRQMAERPESPTSRAEMYFRLASAFGSPTRTGMFTENLALAGREMGEFAKGRRAEEAERRALGLRAQELRMTGARQDLASLQTLAGQEATERRAVNSRIIDSYIRSGEPQSNAGRTARDEGYQPGTPEYEARVRQLTDLNVNRMQELINAQQENIALRRAGAEQLSTQEVTMVADAQQNLSAARDNLESLRKALALNPNTAPASLTTGTITALRRQLGSESPIVTNTDELVNILSRLSLASLKDTFPGAISNEERRALQELQGITAQNLESRRRIIQNAITNLERLIPRTEARIAELRSGSLSRRVPQESATPQGGTQGGATTQAPPGGATQPPAGGR